MHSINIPIQKIIENYIEHILLFQSIVCKLGNHVQYLEANLLFITKEKQRFGWGFFFHMRNKKNLKLFLDISPHELQFSLLLFNWHMTFSIPKCKTSASCTWSWLVLMKLNISVSWSIWFNISVRVASTVQWN